MTGNTETEVKIPLKDRAAVICRLQSAGFAVSSARTFESNTVYDTPDHSLRRAGEILRLRQFGDKSVITWKGRGDPGPYKSRPELETSLGSIETLSQILERLGYAPAFRYEKYRTEFKDSRNPSSGVVTVDETPIGDFLEIEGDGEWIDRTALELEFSAKDYVLESYGKLYLEDCRRRDVEPQNMVFASDD